MFTNARCVLTAVKKQRTRRSGRFRIFLQTLSLYFQCWKDEDLSPACLKRIRALRIPIVGFIWDSNLVPRGNEIWLFEIVDYQIVTHSINACVRWKMLARLMAEPKHVLFGGGLNYVDSAESVTATKTHDVTFVGSAEGERAGLIRYLRSELAKRSIDFVKAGGLVNDDTSASDTERRWLSPEEYNQAIRQSRICLSSQTATSRAQIKGKIFEIMARGTLCLAEASSENLRLFPPQVLPTYKDNEDCVAKIEYFLAHPSERQQIEMNAMLWVQEHFDYKRFYQLLLTHAVHRTGHLPSLRAVESEFDLSWANRNLTLPLLANLVTKLVQHIDSVRVQAQTA
jgi:glycosyl transferase family 1